MPLETFEKTVAQLINQLTQVFNNFGSFVYADLILSMKAAIYNKLVGKFRSPIDVDNRNLVVHYKQVRHPSQLSIL